MIDIKKIDKYKILYKRVNELSSKVNDSKNSLENTNSQNSNDDNVDKLSKKVEFEGKIIKEMKEIAKQLADLNSNLTEEEREELKKLDL